MFPKGEFILLGSDQNKVWIHNRFYISGLKQTHGSDLVTKHVSSTLKILPVHYLSS